MLQIHNIRINLQGKGGHIYKKGVYLNQWARDRPTIQTTSQNNEQKSNFKTSQSIT